MSIILWFVKNVWHTSIYSKYTEFVKNKTILYNSQGSGLKKKPGKE